MIDLTLLARKLAHLHHQLDRARSKRPADLAAFLAQEDSQALVALALAQQMTLTVKVRNLIAHGYSSLQPERLWNDLPGGLAALERYAAAIARFAQPG